MSGTQVTAWVGRELSGGRYRVDAQLGEGGMGTVFRAWDKNLSTEVVVKVPHASMLQDAEFAARFAREISSLVKLSHPHIVKISDVGEADGLPFAVMQFLPGGSLEDRQRSDSRHLIQARSASEGSAEDSLFGLVWCGRKPIVNANPIVAAGVAQILVGEHC